MQVEFPEDMLGLVAASPDELVRELRLAAALHWYQRGAISQAKGAQIAGLERREFVLALARERVDALTVRADDARRELEYSMRAQLALLGQ